MKVPGFLWTAVLALIPLIVEWLQGDYFSGQTWVSVVVLILGFVAKALELYLASRQPAAGLEAYANAPEPSQVRRFLLG